MIIIINSNFTVTNQQMKMENGTQLEFFSNSDIFNIVTPVNVKTLTKLMEETRYPKQKARKLIEGFTYGFDIGYNGPWNRQDTSHNLPLTVGSKEELYMKIMKEVKLKRFAGPFKKIPFNQYVQSPIRLVPKAGNQTRLIFHLSYQFKTTDNQSINFHTPKEKCRVKYNDLDHAVESSFRWQNLSEGAKSKVLYAKTDVKSAFRIIPLRPSCFRWLIMKAINPANGQLEYFADKCLPFGHSISCSLFQEFSECLKHIIEFITRRPHSVTNYLDDFLFVAPSQMQCNNMVRQFLILCSQVGVPVAEEKTEPASQLMVFLGILLNGKRFLLTIPENKRLRAKNMLEKLNTSKKSTVKELESLAGLLNFLGRAIVPGRTFTRRIYAKFSKLTANPKLRNYHHVRIDGELRSDCQIWLKFLDMTRHTSISRPFIDMRKGNHSEILQFHSDATANENLGFGILFDEFWTFQRWEPGFVKCYNPSIEFLELYAVAMGLFIWSEDLANRRFMVFCDNLSVVGMLNKSSSGCKFCMTLIRKITLRALNYNFRVFAEHIKGTDNFLSDNLSRLKIKKFFELARTSNRIVQARPVPLHTELWPLSKFWKTNCAQLT